MTKFQHLTIYYFSGTGNTLASAQWTAEVARERGLSTELISIDRFKEIKKPSNQENCIIGFMNPTHGFFVPWLMFRFMLKFPKIKGASVFFLNTRGGMRIWKLHTPGITGIAHIIPAIIFLLKGMKILGAHPLDTPHNFISIAPPQNKRGQEAMYPRNQRSCIRFANRIFDGKFSYHPKAWLSLPIDIALIPITFGYVIMARFLIGKLLFASHTCNNCGICINNCPVNGIVTRHNRPYWTIECESCMRCMNICPKKSIQSWATRLALAYVACIPLFYWSIDEIHKFAPIRNTYLSFAFDNAYAMGYQFIIVPIYFIFTWLISFRIINKIFTYTSLSMLWGRFINRFVKVRDLMIAKKSSN